MIASDATVEEAQLLLSKRTNLKYNVCFGSFGYKEGLPLLRHRTKHVEYCGLGGNSCAGNEVNDWISSVPSFHVLYSDIPKELSLLVMESKHICKNLGFTAT